MSAAVLELRGAKAGYGRGPSVLRSVSCRFPAGALTAVLGPNGAGKTTLLRVLLGSLPLRAGAALFNDVPVAALSAQRRRRSLALVAQRPRAAAPFTARELIALGANAQRDAAAQLEAALDLLELGPLADTPFAALSAGQQQRTALARALAQLGLAAALADDSGEPAAGAPPCAILADEPASAMDPRWALRAMQLLRRCAERGLAVVCAMHDLSLACRFADRAVVLDASGGAAQEGDLQEVMASGALERVYQVQLAHLAAHGAQAIVPVEEQPSPKAQKA